MVGFIAGKHFAEQCYWAAVGVAMAGMGGGSGWSGKWVGMWVIRYKKELIH